MRYTPMDPAVLAQLRARTAGMACPTCGAVALTIRERYDPLRTEPQAGGMKLAYGPQGRPLWAWCGECDAHGRVADVTHAGGPPS